MSVALPPLATRAMSSRARANSLGCPSMSTLLTSREGTPARSVSMIRRACCLSMLLHRSVVDKYRLHEAPVHPITGTRGQDVLDRQICEGSSCQAQMGQAAVQGSHISRGRCQ